MIKWYVFDIMAITTIVSRCVAKIETHSGCKSLIRVLCQVFFFYVCQLQQQHWIVNDPDSWSFLLVSLFLTGDGFNRLLNACLILDSFFTLLYNIVLCNYLVIQDQANSCLIYCEVGKGQGHPFFNSDHLVFKMEVKFPVSALCVCV